MLLAANLVVSTTTNWPNRLSFSRSPSLSPLLGICAHAPSRRAAQETQTATVLINAPRVFAAFWSIVKRVLHPSTAAKIAVAGAAFRATLEDLGIHLDDARFERGGRVLRAPPPWVATLADLKASWPTAQLVRSFLPDADARALERAGVRARGEAGAA